MAGYFVLTEPFSCGDNLRWRNPPTQRQAQKASATQRPEAKRTFVDPPKPKAELNCCGNLTVAFHSAVTCSIQPKSRRTCLDAGQRQPTTLEHFRRGGSVVMPWA